MNDSTLRKMAEKAGFNLLDIRDQFDYNIDGVNHYRVFMEMIVKECIRIDKENPDAAPGVEIACYFGVQE